MPVDVLDPFSELENEQGAPSNPYSELERDAEPPAEVYWAGRPTTMAAIERAAKNHDMTPDQVMRLGTWQGRVEQALATDTYGPVKLGVPIGGTLVSLAEGAQGVGDTAVSIFSDAFGDGGMSKAIHNERIRRQEFAQKISRGDAVEDLLGERASRVYKNTVQSLGEIGMVSVATGGVGTYSYIAGSSWDRALDQGERQGMSGKELVGYAGLQAGIEGAFTYLGGKAGAKLGLETTAAALSPAGRRAVQQFLGSEPVRNRMAELTKAAGGMAAEAVEEMLISGGQQIVDLSHGVAEDFDWDALIDSGLGGATGRGLLGAQRGLVKEIKSFQKKLPAIAEGTRAAEIDLERGVNPFEVRDVADVKELSRQTGHKFASKESADSYRNALDFYIDEARKNGEHGALRRMEEDVKKIREEERQRDARIRESKQKAKQNKGKAGESQVAVEPVQEQPTLTANERATFNLDEFERRVNPQDFQWEETLTPAPVNINPYILAPWESETRMQRSLRTRNRDLAEAKAKLKALRKDAVEKRRLTAAQQQSAYDLVNEHIPREEQHKFFKGVLQSTKPSAINRLLDRVVKAVDAREHNNAVRLLKESFRKAKGLRAEFQSQVDALKQGVDTKRIIGEQRQVLDQWLRAGRRAGKETGRAIADMVRTWASGNPNAVFSDAQKSMLDRLEKKNVNGMDAAELIELADTVESLAYQSALKDRLIGNMESASARDVGDSIALDVAKAPRKEMRSDSFVFAAKDSLLGQDIDRSQDRTITGFLAKEGAERPEATLMQLGPSAVEHLYEPIRRGREKYQIAWVQDSQVIADAIESTGLSLQDSLAASVSYAFGGDGTGFNAWRSGQKRMIGGQKLTRGEAWLMHLYSFDPVATARMLETGKFNFDGGDRSVEYTPQTMVEVADFIGPEGEAIARTVFDVLNGTVIDRVNAENEKITGRPLTDKRNVVPMFLTEQEATTKLLTGVRGAQEVLLDSYGHLKHRGQGDRPLGVSKGVDGFTAVMAHINRMARIQGYMTAARNSELLLNDPEVKRSIIEKNGTAGYKSIVDSVKTEVAGYGAVDDVSKAIGHRAHAVAGGLVGYKLSVALAQPLDNLVSLPYKQNAGADWLEGAKEIAVRGDTLFEEMDQVMSLISGEYNHRYGQNRFSEELTGGMYRQPDYLRPKSLVEHGAEFLQGSEKLAVGMPQYAAAKAEARRKLGMAPNDYSTPLDNEQWSQIVADTWGRQMVRGSNSSHGMELSGVQRFVRRHPLAALGITFTNQAGKIYTLASMAQNHLRRGDWKTAGNFAASVAASQVLFSALQAALSFGEKDKEKYDYWERVAIRSAKNIVGTHPLALGAADSIVNELAGLPTFGSNPILFMDVAERMGKGATNMYDVLTNDVSLSEEPEKAVKALVDLGSSLGPIFGAPTAGPTDILHRVYEGTPFPGLRGEEQYEYDPGAGMFQ